MAEEPQALRERPHVGRFPVPAVTAVIDGRPDFKVHDELARARCAALRLCQLCGKLLGPRFVFVGAADSLERRTFGEPPMHQACLDFAFDACPFLAGAGYRDGWREAAREAGMTVGEPQAPPPDLGVYWTAQYWLIPDDEGLTEFKYRAGSPLKIEWRKRG